MAATNMSQILILTGQSVRKAPQTTIMLRQQTSGRMLRHLSQLSSGHEVQGSFSQRTYSVSCKNFSSGQEGINVDRRIRTSWHRYGGSWIGSATLLRSPLSVHHSPCRFSSASSSEESKEDDDDNKNNKKTEEEDDDENKEQDDGEWTTIYESPYDGSIMRLRGVSLFSCVAGIVGLPIAMVLSEKTQQYDPSSLAFWLICGTFAFGTLSTTAAITYVFSPYVLEIQQKRVVTPGKSPTDLGSSSLLFKATTRTMFLSRKDHVFDPETGLRPFSGILHPLSNLVAHTDTSLDNDDNNKTSSSSSSSDVVYLFVHPELAQDNAILYNVLQEPAKSQSQSFTPPKQPVNPDQAVQRKSTGDSKES